MPITVNSTEPHSSIILHALGAHYNFQQQAGYCVALKKLNKNIAYRIAIAFYYNLYSEKEGWLVSNLPSTIADIAVN
jgi:hypothetical protein